MTTIRLFKGKPFDDAQPNIDWSVVYLQQLPRMYNFFLYQVNDMLVAEDLTAITFQRAWQSRHRYRTDLSAFTTWLFSIARRVAADYFRSVKPIIPLESIAEIVAEETLDEAAQQNADMRRLAVLIGQLSPSEHELIALKYGAGMTNREIAQVTQLSESNVGTILHRVIRKLREQWEE